MADIQTNRLLGQLKASIRSAALFPVTCKAVRTGRAATCARKHADMTHQIDMGDAEQWTHSRLQGRSDHRRPGGHLLCDADPQQHCAWAARS